MKYFTLIFSLMASFAFCQPVLIPIESDFPDSIKQVVIGDLDDDGKDNTYVITKKGNLVYKLSYAAGKMNRKIYTSVTDVESMFIAQMNNSGDDALYSVKGKKGLNVFYGKDSYNAELKSSGFIGETELSNVKDIETVEAQIASPFNFNLLSIMLDNNEVFYWRSQSSSFDLIASSKVTSIKYPFSIIGSASSSEQNKAYNYFYLTSNKELVKVKVILNGPNLALEPVVKVDLSLVEPTVITSKAGILYIYDKSKKSITQYNTFDASKKEVTLEGIGNIEHMKVGTFDSNTDDDLILQTGNEIYYLSDFGLKRSGPVKLVSENESISNLYLFDLEGDNFDEFCYYLKDSKILKTYKNETPTAVTDTHNEAISFGPNPSTGILKFNKNVEEVNIFDLTGKLVLNYKNVDQINIDFLQSGKYFIKIINQNKITYKYCSLLF